MLACRCAHKFNLQDPFGRVQEQDAGDRFRTEGLYHSLIRLLQNSSLLRYEQEEFDEEERKKQKKRTIERYVWSLYLCTDNRAVAKLNRITDQS